MLEGIIYALCAKFQLPRKLSPLAAFERDQQNDWLWPIFAGPKTQRALQINSLKTCTETTSPPLYSNFQQRLNGDKANSPGFLPRTSRDDAFKLIMIPLLPLMMQPHLHSASRAASADAAAAAAADDDDADDDHGDHQAIRKLVHKFTLLNLNLEK